MENPIFFPTFPLSSYDNLDRRETNMWFYTYLSHRFDNISIIKDDYKLTINTVENSDNFEMLVTPKMFLPISIKTERHHHALLLIIREHSIEIFDPMGRGKYHKHVKSFIKRNLGDKIIINSPKRSFQYYEKKERSHPPHYKGLCGFWVGWYIYYLSLNSFNDKLHFNDFHFNALDKVEKIGFCHYIDSFISSAQKKRL